MSCRRKARERRSGSVEAGRTEQDGAVQQEGHPCEGEAEVGEAWVSGGVSGGGAGVVPAITCPTQADPSPCVGSKHQQAEATHPQRSSQPGRWRRRLRVGGTCEGVSPRVDAEHTRWRTVHAERDAGHLKHGVCHRLQPRGSARCAGHGSHRRRHRLRLASVHSAHTRGAASQLPVTTASAQTVAESGRCVALRRAAWAREVWRARYFW